MEYIGNRPNPNPTNPNPYPYDDFPWWNYNPYGNVGGYDPYAPNWTPPTPGQEGLQPVGGGEVPPTTPTEGQTTETPGGTPPEVDENGNPVFRTDVTGNAPPPVDYLPSDIGQLNPYLAEYIASLPQNGGGSAGGGVNFSVDTTGFTDPTYPFPGPYGDPQDIEANLPPSTFTAEGTTKIHDFPGPYDWPEFNPNPPPSYKFDAEGTYKPPPDIVGWPEFKFTPNKPPREFPVSIFPIIDKVKKVITGGGGEEGGGGGGGGKQQQQPGVGKLLAALPMLAAFQGGTTTTPAPYAHLGPHTPVAPVFKPQARGNPIPSIGQLLAGVR